MKEHTHHEEYEFDEVLDLMGEIEEDDEVIFDLLDYLDESVSMYHSVLATKERLVNGGFEELGLTDKWNLVVGGKYFTIVNNSTVIAFVVGQDKDAGYRIIGAHGDSPALKIKANPIIKKGGYLLVNTEIYGGPILETWFDRPLSIAGRVLLRGESAQEPKVALLNIDEDLLTIPSLAIHMTRDLAKEDLYKPHEHLFPVLGVEEDFDLKDLIAYELDVDKEDILGQDLYIYNRDKAKILGLNGDFFQSGRIDNIGMMHAGLEAILNAQPTAHTQVFAGFDNEEIGSKSQQGAASVMFRDILRKISLTLGGDEVSFINQVYKSCMVSADQAHGAHPNYLDKADPTNRPVINKGPVIKFAARKTYVTDGVGASVLNAIAQENSIPIQYYFNRSDIKGGSTIGSIIETTTGIRNIDVGNSTLAMHSANELAGIEDHLHMIQLLTKFLES